MSRALVVLRSRPRRTAVPRVLAGPEVPTLHAGTVPLTLVQPGGEVGTAGGAQQALEALVTGQAGGGVQALERWQDSSVTARLGYAYALQGAGDQEGGLAALQRAAEMAEQGGVAEDTLRVMRAQAHWHLAALDIPRARGVLHAALALVPEGGPQRRALPGGGVQPQAALESAGTLFAPVLLGLWYSLALVCVLSEDWLVAGTVLKHALKVPGVQRQAALHAGLQALSLLRQVLMPGGALSSETQAVRAALRSALEKLPPHAARLPRVAVALDDAARGEPGAQLRLAGMHAELSDVSLHAAEGTYALQRVIEEGALLLAVPGTEPRSLYGRALQLCWDGHPGGPRLMEQVQGSPGVAGSQRRAALYWQASLPGSALTDAIDASLLRAPGVPLLDRLNYERLSQVPGLPLSVVSRLVLLGERRARPVTVNVTLMSQPGLYEQRRRLLPDLSVQELVLLALLEQADAPSSAALTPETLRAAVLSPEERAPGVFERMTARLLVVAEPLGLIESQDGGSVLRVSRWGRLECDVLVLSDWLERGQLWDALHLLRGALPSLAVPWLVQRRARILTLLYSQIVRLDVQALPAGERSRLYQAFRWMFTELAVTRPAALGLHEQQQLKAMSETLWNLPAG